MENILDEMNIKWHNLEYSDFSKLWSKAKLILKEDKNEF
jgi:hypothetical protein